jgi:hypothetical protein
VIGFETLDGFLILLLLPLTLWFRRRRWRLREFVATLYPFLEQSRSSETQKPHRTFRISKLLRDILFGMVLLLLSLTYNGIYLTYRTETPGEWFIVYDNTYPSTALSNDVSVHEWNTRELRSLIRKFPDQDRFTLMVTAPRPSIYPGRKKGDFVSLLENVKPSFLSPGIDRVLGMLLSTVKDENLKGLIVVSARTGKWKKTIGDKVPAPGIFIPQYMELGGGNAGITALDLNPVGSGKYDLFFKVRSHGRPERELVANLQVEDGPVRTLPIRLDSTGSARVHLESYSLESGKVSLSLYPGDLFEADDRVIFEAVAQKKNIKVASDRELRLFLRKAIQAYPNIEQFVRDPSGSRDTFVHIYDRSVPPGPISGPTLIIFPTVDYDNFILQKIWTSPLDPDFHPLHPITRNVRFRSFRSSMTSQLTVPEGYSVLARGGDIPLVISGELNGHRLVIWTFDPENNGIYLDPSFAILTGETLQWLASADYPEMKMNGLCTGFEGGSDQGNVPWSSEFNILCPSVTEEAGHVTLVNFSEELALLDQSKSIERKDLDRLALILAFLLILVLAADSNLVAGGRY